MAAIILHSRPSCILDLTICGVLALETAPFMDATERANLAIYQMPQGDLIPTAILMPYLSTKPSPSVVGIKREGNF